MSASLDDMSDAERLQDDLDNALIIYSPDGFLAKQVIETFIEFVCFQKNIAKIDALLDKTLMDEYLLYTEATFQHTAFSEPVHRTIYDFIRFYTNTFYAK